MERVNHILRHPIWIEEMDKIQKKEKTRIFCGHGISHLLDVARISYILCLEEDIPIDKELLYAAALLHDIGRGREYTEGIPHEEAGSQIAEQILSDCGFREKEKKQIISAIRSHRSNSAEQGRTLSDILYFADKKSRCCFACSAEKECNWKEEAKNKIIER